jgi:hypothetical protein
MISIHEVKSLEISLLRLWLVVETRQDNGRIENRAGHGDSAWRAPRARLMRRLADRG